MALPTLSIVSLLNFTSLIEENNCISLMFEFAFSLLLVRLSICLCFNLPFVFSFGTLPVCVLVPLFWYGIAHHFLVNY